VDASSRSTRSIAPPGSRDDVGISARGRIRRSEKKKNHVHVVLHIPLSPPALEGNTIWRAPVSFKAVCATIYAKSMPTHQSSACPIAVEISRAFPDVLSRPTIRVAVWGRPVDVHEINCKNVYGRPDARPRTTALHASSSIVSQASNRTVQMTVGQRRSISIDGPHRTHKRKNNAPSHIASRVILECHDDPRPRRTLYLLFYLRPRFQFVGNG
jgi:hypothetical protein